MTAALIHRPTGPVIHRERRSELEPEISFWLEDERAAVEWSAQVEREIHAMLASRLVVARRRAYLDVRNSAGVIASTVTAAPVAILAAFTTPGAITWTPPGGVSSYSALIIGGGAQGGHAWPGGGGGGGAAQSKWVTARSCTPGVGISGVVGQKGIAFDHALAGAAAPIASSLGSDTAAVGGGGGGGPGNAGIAGACGGGGCHNVGPGAGSPGFNGGNGSTFVWNSGGGGGGMASTPANAVSSNGDAGYGGLGIDYSANVGTTYGVAGLFVGGGGGGNGFGSNLASSAYGGGHGGANGDGGNATANTGGGGGGGGSNGPLATAGHGGSGIVIVSYF